MDTRARRTLERCLGWGRRQAEAFLGGLAEAELAELLVISDSENLGVLLHHWLDRVTDRQTADRVTAAAIDASHLVASADAPSPAEASEDPHGSGDEARAASGPAVESQAMHLVDHDRAGGRVTSDAAAASPETPPASHEVDRPSPAAPMPDPAVT